MTVTRIARLLGLAGLTAFLALAARTSTATPALDEDPTLPLPSPAVVDSIGIPPLPTIPPPPPTESELKPKDESKPAKDKETEAAPEIVPAPIAPAEPADDELSPLPLDFGGDNLPAVSPAPEPPSIAPPRVSTPVIDELMMTPAPSRVEPRKAWRAEREGAPGRIPVAVEVEVDEVAAVAPDDPGAQARSFVERNQREAEARLKALNDEAEELRGRLAKVETAIAQWQALADAMKQAQDAAVARPEAPQTKPEEPAPAPRAARAQDVPAPPLR